MADYFYSLEMTLRQMNGNTSALRLADIANEENQ